MDERIPAIQARDKTLEQIYNQDQRPYMQSLGILLELRNPQIKVEHTVQILEPGVGVTQRILPIVECVMGLRPQYYMRSTKVKIEGRECVARFTYYEEEDTAKLEPQHYDVHLDLIQRNKIICQRWEAADDRS